MRLLLAGFAVVFSFSSADVGASALSSNRAKKYETTAVKFGSLWVTADPISSFCSDLFAPISVRFSNPTQQWITVSNVSFSFGESVDENVTVVTGPGLASWYDAMSNRVAAANLRSQQMLSVIGVIGLAATAGNNSSTRSIGGMTALGSVGLLTAQSFKNASINLKSSGLVPDNHLLAGEILVPPGLHADRWILFNSVDDGSLPYLTKFNLQLSQNGESIPERFVTFRSDEVPSQCGWLSQSSDRPKR